MSEPGHRSREGGHHHREGYHSLDNRGYRARDYSRDSRYTGDTGQGWSESDSEWAEDRDGWSDR